MPATPIANPLTGESLLGIEPQLLQQVDPGWRYRMNLFTGRALTDTALDGEQAYRAGLLATLGQSVTPGTVKGLVLSLNTAPADPVLTVTPGYGIAASGEDVTVIRTLQTNLSTLAVIDPVTGLLEQQFETYRLNAANLHVGIFLLQPIVAQVSGQAFDTGSEPFEVSGNLAASCDQDPQEYAFEDWQIADGARLVFVPWPSGVAALPLPDSNPAGTWRNRLAYTIFDAEAQLVPDAQFPWMMLGVPLALVAFDTNWNPLFIDRSTVVRPGGLPRLRYILPSVPQQPLVWEPGTVFTAGALILDSNGNVQQAQTTGASGNLPPKWSMVKGQPTTDVGVTWSNMGSGAWSANTEYTAGEFIFDSNGNLQTVLVAGLSGGSEPTWSDVFLPTSDNAVTWVNNQVTGPSIVQPALAQARVAQIAEQVGDQLGEAADFGNFSAICSVLPPSGILPVASVDLVNKQGLWFPPNWSLSAGPIRFEELEAALETGMFADPIEVAATAPADPTLLEDVEVLVPLPDQLYDPNILVTETVAPDFQRQIDDATSSRNAVLHTRKAVQLELNALNTALGPNSPPPNPNAIDLNAGLTPAEIAGRDTLPPLLPQPNVNPNLDQTFGTVGPATWQPNAQYSYGQFIIDSNGNIQVVHNSPGGTSGGSQPAWNPSPGALTTDPATPPPGAPTGITWFNNGPGTWQANTAYATWQTNTSYVMGQFIFDVNGAMQIATTNGTSGSSQYVWGETGGAQTNDAAANAVRWVNTGKASSPNSHANWAPNTAYPRGASLVDPAGNVQTVLEPGTSGSSEPTWSAGTQGITLDPGVIWQNIGPAAWQSNHAYTTDTEDPLGHAIVDANGNLQVVQTAGTSGASPPMAWATDVGEGTQDGPLLMWINEGPPTIWEPNTVYELHQCFVDPAGNIQEVQCAGTSGSSQFIWNQNSGKPTSEGSNLTWSNDGPGMWQRANAYTVGQFVLDSNGNIQAVQAVQSEGTSGIMPPAWKTTFGQTTTDAGITWINYGPGTWRGNTTYAVGQFVFDSNGNIQTVQSAGESGSGESGSASPTWATVPPQPTAGGVATGGVTTDGALTWICQVWASTDLQGLQRQAAAAPYTVTYTDENNDQQTLPLIQAGDWQTLADNGLQAFIDSLNARIKRANDLLDLAFLTSQTDIYRIRQNVLTATDATKLATSPILANIATGETAAATAGDLQGYFTTLFGQTAATGGSEESQAAQAAAAAPSETMATGSPAPTMARQMRATRPSSASTSIPRTISPLAESSSFARTGSLSEESFVQQKINLPEDSAEFTLPQGQNIFQARPSGITAIVNLPSSQQITEQAPIVGAQLDVRTLTIAERLAQSPSQESLFYTIGNRLAFMQTLQGLAALGLTLGDLQFLVDGATWQPNFAYTVGQTIIDPNGNVEQVQTVATNGTSGATPPGPTPPGTASPLWNTTLNGATTDGGITWINKGLPIGTTTNSPATSPASFPIPTESHYVSELGGSNAQAVLYKLQNPYVVADVDEGDSFRSASGFWSNTPKCSALSKAACNCTLTL